MDNKDIAEILKKYEELLDQLILHFNFSENEDKRKNLRPVYKLNTSSFEDSREKYLNLLDERKKGLRKGIYISSGFAQLDELIGGFYEGELTVIGGRPGIGKTSLILSIILSLLKNHIPVALYSLELTREALIDRLVSMKKKIPITLLRAGKLTDKEYDKIDKGLLELSKSNLYFIDGAIFSPENFSDMLSYLVNEKGIRILFIDYLQLMISNRQRRNREQEVSELMKFLKSFALEYKIPVIITSQMNRYVEWRGGAKRPILSDLRESGTIEEIADKVLFIYRAEAYGIPMDEEGNSTASKAELIVAKNRLGPAGDLILFYNKNFGLFENINWDKKVFPSLKLPDNPFNEGPF